VSNFYLSHPPGTTNLRVPVLSSSCWRDARRVFPAFPYLPPKGGRRSVRNSYKPTLSCALRFFSRLLFFSTPLGTESRQQGGASGKPPPMLDHRMAFALTRCDRLIRPNFPVFEKRPPLNGCRCPFSPQTHHVRRPTKLGALGLTCRPTSNLGPNLDVGPSGPLILFFKPEADHF